MFRVARLGCVLLLALVGSRAYGEARHPFPELEKAVEGFERTKLPAHPRMVLDRGGMKRVAEAAGSEWGKEHWGVVRGYVEQGRKVEPPGEPKGYPGGKWNVTDWRRIVAVGDEYQTRILAASFAAVVTGEERDVAEAKRWALAAAKLDPMGMTGIRGVDHPARDILHAVALSYDWLYDRYTAEERKALRECIVARGREMYKYLKPLRGDAWNNHVWFETSALVDAGLAVADEVPEADAWWRYGSELYLTEFLPKGGRDGDWHEGTHYVSYTLMFVYQWADALKTATGIDAYSVPWLQKVGDFCLYVSPPGKGGIQFNDNNYDSPPNLADKANAYVCARVTRDPVLQWYGDQIQVPAGETQVRHRIELLMAHDPTIEARPPGKELPLGVWFRDSGWAVMRTDLASSEDVQFGLKGGKYYGSERSKGHDHPDQNSFLINYLGEPLAVDSGYYDWYGSPHHKGWTFTGKAHNSILVDGQEELVGKDGRIVSFVSDREGMDFVESEAGGTFAEGLLKSWRRQVVFLRPDVFVVRDVVKLGKAGTVSWLLHGPREFTIGGQLVEVTNKEATLVGRMVEPKEGLEVKQWVGFPEDAQPERKKAGDYPDQTHLSMTTPGKVGEETFCFVLRVGKVGVKMPGVEDVATSDGSDQRSIVSPDGGRYMVRFFDDPTQLHSEGELQGKMRMWATGRVPKVGGTAITAAGTTVLRADNTVLWESDKPADIAGNWSSVRLTTQPSRARTPTRTPSRGPAPPHNPRLRGNTVQRKSHPGWRWLNVRLDEASTVRFTAIDSTLLVDGKETAVKPDENGWVSLSLEAGAHILRAR